MDAFLNYDIMYHNMKSRSGNPGNCRPQLPSLRRPEPKTMPADTRVSLSAPSDQRQDATADPLHVWSWSRWMQGGAGGRIEVGGHRSAAPYPRFPPQTDLRAQHLHSRVTSATGRGPARCSSLPSRSARSMHPEQLIHRDLEIIGRARCHQSQPWHISSKVERTPLLTSPPPSHRPARE
jgi:hypothetical protein